jgi:hypothetical protein
MNVRASLTGYEETPAVSTTANGRFSARQVADGVFEYTLSYANIEGSPPNQAPTQAHIHFGQPGVSGGISVFLCTNLGNSPGTQACPPAPATITGTFTAADVIGPAAQGIDVGELDELIAAIDSGMAYCNIHSSRWGAGEARGQLGPGTGQR